MLFDNGSTPSLKRIAEREKILYLRSETNLGYAGGCNFVIENILAQQKDYQAICLINNDIFIDQEFANKTTSRLSAFFENKKLAAFTPILYKDSQFKTVDNFGVLYYRSGLAFQSKEIDKHHQALLNGAFIFLKTSICKKLLQKDGFIFMPEFFLNMEDVELSLRLLSRGYQIQIDPNLKAQHLGSQTKKPFSKTSLYFGWRNISWTALISRNRKDLIFDLPFLLLGQGILLILSFHYKCFFFLPRIYIETIKKIPMLYRLRRIYHSHNLPKKYLLNGICPKGYLLK